MHIIPPGLTPDQRELAERLAADATDPAIQAATRALLRMNGTPILRPDLAQDYIHDGDDCAAIRWLTLGSQLLAGVVPASPSEQAVMHAACGLAGWHTAAMDPRQRRLLVEAVAHACGVPLMPAVRSTEQQALITALREEGTLAAGRPEGDGSEPIPAGVDGHPAGHRQEPRQEIGDDDCGCPVTAVPQGNGGWTSGTERTDHRSRCPEQTDLTAGYADAVIQALRAAGLTVARHQVIAGQQADITLAHPMPCWPSAVWPHVVVGWRPAQGWCIVPVTKDDAPADTTWLELDATARPAEVAAMVAELLRDDPAERAELGAPDDPRDLDEEHAVPEPGPGAEIADALTRLAELMRHADITPTRHLSVGMGVVATIDDLETWAALLGTPIIGGGTSGTIPVIRAEDIITVGGTTVSVRVQALEPAPSGGESR